MPHLIRYTEDIEERGYCQQQPDLKKGEKYLYETEGTKRLRIVKSVQLDRYVWERVARWSIEIVEYLDEEYVLSRIADVPVFVAGEMLGVLTCDKDKICGELVIPEELDDHRVCGVIQYGFYDCSHLTKVVFSPMVVIVYEWAFAQSGLKEMVFNDEIPVFVHASAIDDCKNLPQFNRLFSSPFPGKHLFHSGPLFQRDEAELRRLHFIR